MIVTKQNIKNIQYIREYHNLDIAKSVLDSLLDDIEEFNNKLKCDGFINKQIYIDYIDIHTEYSPERTDPCPDYYGLFRIRFTHNTKTIGDVMSLNELDFCLCALYDFISY